MDKEEFKRMQKELEKRVLTELDLTREVENEELYHVLDQCMNELPSNEYLTLREKMQLRQIVFYSMRGLDVLTPLLEDDTVTEIMVNGYNHIFVEREGVLHNSGLQFADEEKYHDIIQHIVADSNRTVNEASPIVDARLKDGSRVNVVLSPISLDGSALTIRKFPKEPISMERLIELGSLDKGLAQLLELFVISGYNIVISGGTGSGKTTFLNALSNYIPKNERIVTIEDSAELQLQNVQNLVRLEVRNANVEGKLAISMKDLIKSSLRMRPDRIIIGEVRGEEALDLLQALNTGHDGSISTGHANSARDMLTRLETMVMMGFDMPIKALRGQIASAVELVIHLGRLRDHSRRVIEIMEVLQMNQDEIVCQTLFQFEEQSNQNNSSSQTVSKQESVQHIRVQGQLVKKHQLKQIAKLKEAGYYDRFCELMRRWDSCDMMSTSYDDSIG